MVPRTSDLSLSVLDALSRIRPVARIIPRPSSIVTGLSVCARSCFGITCRNSSQARCAWRRQAPVPPRVSHGPSLRNTRSRDRRRPVRARLDRERRLAGPRHRELRPLELDRAVIRIVPRHGRRQRLRRPAVGVEFDRTHAFGEQVRIVASAAVPARSGIVHLRIQPVGEAASPRAAAAAASRRGDRASGVRCACVQPPRAGAPCAPRPRRAAIAPRVSARWPRARRRRRRRGA